MMIQRLALVMLVVFGTFLAGCEGDQGLEENVEESGEKVEETLD